MEPSNPAGTHRLTPRPSGDARCISMVMNIVFSSPPKVAINAPAMLSPSTAVQKRSVHTANQARLLSEPSGSTCTNFTELTTQYPSAKVLELPLNYRAKGKSAASGL